MPPSHDAIAAAADTGPAEPRRAPRACRSGPPPAPRPFCRHRRSEPPPPAGAWFPSTPSSTACRRGRRTEAPPGEPPGSRDIPSGPSRRTLPHRSPTQSSGFLIQQQPWLNTLQKSIQSRPGLRPGPGLRLRSGNGHSVSFGLRSLAYATSTALVSGTGEQNLSGTKAPNSDKATIRTWRSGTRGRRCSRTTGSRRSEATRGGSRRS